MRRYKEPGKGKGKAEAKTAARESDQGLNAARERVGALEREVATLKDELTAAREQADQANRAKAGFLATP